MLIEIGPELGKTITDVSITICGGFIMYIIYRIIKLDMG